MSSREGCTAIAWAASTAAATIAVRQGLETHLVEQKNYLGGLLENIDLVAPADLPAHRRLAEVQGLPRAREAARLGDRVEDA